MDDNKRSKDGIPLPGNQQTNIIPTPKTPAKRIAFMGGNADFRAARMRCALACEEYNKSKEDAAVEDRTKAWLKIVDPDYETNIGAESVVDFSTLFEGDATSTDDDTPPPSPTIIKDILSRRTIPYIKTPVYIDYGLRVSIQPTTFINRNFTILDTPVADVKIGMGCSIGPGVTIISVGHPVDFGERREYEGGKPGSWGADVVVGHGVWIGAGVTILPGVTIGSDSTIGAGSLVNKDIPSRCVAAGNPATVRYFLDDKKEPTTYGETAHTLEDALKVGRDRETDGTSASRAPAG